MGLIEIIVNYNWSEMLLKIRDLDTEIFGKLLSYPHRGRSEKNECLRNLKSSCRRYLPGKAYWASCQGRLCKINIALGNQLQMSNLACVRVFQWVRRWKKIQGFGLLGENQYPGWRLHLLVSLIKGIQQKVEPKKLNWTCVISTCWGEFVGDIY